MRRTSVDSPQTRGSACVGTLSEIPFCTIWTAVSVCSTPFARTIRYKPKKTIVLVGLDVRSLHYLQASVDISCGSRCSQPALPTGICGYLMRVSKFAACTTYRHLRISHAGLEVRSLHYLQASVDISCGSRSSQPALPTGICGYLMRVSKFAVCTTYRHLWISHAGLEVRSQHYLQASVDISCWSPLTLGTDPYVSRKA